MKSIILHSNSEQNHIHETQAKVKDSVISKFILTALDSNKKFKWSTHFQYPSQFLKSNYLEHYSPVNIKYFKKMVLLL